MTKNLGCIERGERPRLRHSIGPGRRLGRGSRERVRGGEARPERAHPFRGSGEAGTAGTKAEWRHRKVCCEIAAVLRERGAGATPSRPRERRANGMGPRRVRRAFRRPSQPRSRDGTQAAPAPARAHPRVRGAMVLGGRTSAARAIGFSLGVSCCVFQGRGSAQSTGRRSAPTGVRPLRQPPSGADYLYAQRGGAVVRGVELSVYGIDTDTVVVRTGTSCHP